MSRWTEGPWKVFIDEYDGQHQILWMRPPSPTMERAADEIAIVGGMEFSPEDSESTANAHLIAAAPEMAEALEKAVAHFGYLMDCGALTREDGEPLEAMRAALARARGEK